MRKVISKPRKTLSFLSELGKLGYRMEHHLRRFYRSCKYARIEPPVDIAESRAISEKLLSENGRLVPGQELGLV